MKNKPFDPSPFNQMWMAGKEDMDALIQYARNIDPEQLAAFIVSTRKPGNADPPPYIVKDGLAIITVKGMLFKDSYYFSYGNTIRTYSGLTAAANKADADPAVKKKLLKIDSIGGTVAGAFESLAALEKSAKIKPFYTFADSNMKSAALLIGSVGHKIATTKSAEIGSIGVRTTHINESKLNDRIGIEVTHLTAGKYKSMGNPDEPLSKEAKDYFQSRLDTTYSLFIDAVAKNRKMQTDDVLAAADGKVFMGTEAREKGLVDVLVDDLDSFIATITKEDTKMDLKEFKTNHPALYDQIKEKFMAEGKAGAETDQEQKIADARAEGLGSVMSILSVVLGQETADHVQKIVDTGMTVDQLAAAQGIFGENKTPAGETTPPAGTNAADHVSRQQILTGLQISGNPPVNGSPPPAPGEADFMADVEAYMEDKAVSKSIAIQKLRVKNPEQYEKWIADQQK